MINRIIDANPVTWFGNWLFSKSQLLSELAEHISGIFVSKSAQNARNGLFVLGLGALTYRICRSIYDNYKFWQFLPQHIRNTRNFKPQSFKQRYGDCFVLITGAADGIGYAYSR